MPVPARVDIYWDPSPQLFRVDHTRSMAFISNGRENPVKSEYGMLQFMTALPSLAFGLSQDVDQCSFVLWII